MSKTLLNLSSRPLNLLLLWLIILLVLLSMRLKQGFPVLISRHLLVLRKILAFVVCIVVWDWWHYENSSWWWSFFLFEDWVYFFYCCSLTIITPLLVWSNSFLSSPMLINLNCAYSYTNLNPFLVNRLDTKIHQMSVTGDAHLLRRYVSSSYLLSSCIIEIV